MGGTIDSRITDWPFVTSMFNSDPIRIGITYLPGVGPYDALSASVAQFIYIVPFFLARQFMRRPEDNAAILRTLVIAGAHLFATHVI